MLYNYTAVGVSYMCVVAHSECTYNTHIQMLSWLFLIFDLGPANTPMVRECIIILSVVVWRVCGNVCVLGLIGNLADLVVLSRLVLVCSSPVTGLSGTALCEPAACTRDQTCIYRLSRVCNPDVFTQAPWPLACFSAQFCLNFLASVGVLHWRSRNRMHPYASVRSRQNV